MGIEPTYVPDTGNSLPMIPQPPMVNNDRICTYIQGISPMPLTGNTARLLFRHVIHWTQTTQSLVGYSVSNASGLSGNIICDIKPYLWGRATQSIIRTVAARLFFGANCRIRTYDLLITNQLHYQLC